VKVNLAITGVGLVTPVGLNAPECFHAVRSGITRLTRQPYRDRTGEPIVGGNVLTWTATVRERRLRAFAELAIREAWQQAHGHSDPHSLGPTALVLGAPESMRPGYRFPSTSDNVRAWFAKLGIASAGPVEVLPEGATSAQRALARAVQLFDSGAARFCIVGAVDTQLQVRVTRWHENNERLKCAYIHDGLMPGEAACFLVIEMESSAFARRATILARILATAHSLEPANILSDQPNTARALTDSARMALRDAAIQAKDLDAVWCDLNGESYRAREWAFTEIRLGVQTHTELIHPADCHGDLGAASDANLLGLAAMAQATGWAKGQPQLVFSGSEGGLRAVTVICPPPKQPPLLQVTRDLPRVLPVDVAVTELEPDEANYLEAENPARAYFDWQLRQEHLDNLAALHYQRKAVLANPKIPWPRLREPEQRILNHLDAVVAGGATSIWAVASGLLDGEEGKAFAGALLLGILPTPGNLARMNDALIPKEPWLAGVEAGLQHAPESRALTAQLHTWLDHAEPAVRATAISVLSHRRELDPRRVVSFVENGDPLVRLAGIRAARRGRNMPAAPALERLLTAADPEVVHEALRSLLCLGQRTALDRCRQIVLSGFLPAARAQLLLAMCGQLSDLFTLMRAGKALADPVTLEALGILGNVEAVEYLFQALDTKDDEVKGAVAEALQLITAAGLREQASITERTELMPGEFVEETHDVERVATAPAVWRTWWAQNGRRFDPRRRWRRGQPFDFGVVIAELNDPTSRVRDRQRAYSELLILSGQSFAFEPNWFVPRQQEAIARWDSWWTANKPR
jgi:3-oxoacyl-[acyl-carrier-protein] synthase-1